ncbi:MAG: methionyl-tRNA formyltransferase [Gammaproteobacteria bacterium]|nr:methionyl-tRNA formyltransferase [Gammaproteobacteria bacterium]
MRLKIIYAGTPYFALPALEAIYQAGHDIIAVLTQPDRPAGRGQKLQTSVIKDWAIEHQIAVYQPQTLKTAETQAQIKALDADVMVVAAYGLILPQAVLKMPRFGCINIHASILPYWRGAAPIQYAILNGDSETGISIMQMDVGMDTGDVLDIIKCPILADDTAESLTQKLATLAPHGILTTLHNIHDLKPMLQDNTLATYAPKIKKEDAKINWHQDSSSILRQIHAYNPWPSAFTIFQDHTVKIHAATLGPEVQGQPGQIMAIEHQGLLVCCGQGSLCLTIWQWPNAKKMRISDYLHGSNMNVTVGQLFE